MISNYVGQFKLDRFLYLITLFRFILENLENEEKYIGIINCTEKDLESLIEQIINDMKKCPSIELEKLSIPIESDFNHNKSTFVKDFMYILENNFNIKPNSKFEFAVVSTNKLSIKRFWYLLINIFKDIPSLNQELCNYI
jgi:hypothetical protein